MPGLIGQHLPVVFVPNPPLGSSTLVFDSVGDLKIKRNDGSIDSVTINIDPNQIMFGSTTSSPTSSNILTLDVDNYILQFGASHSIQNTSTASVILGGRGSEIYCSSGSIILGGDFYSGIPYGGISGGNKIIGGKNNLVTGGFYCNNYYGCTYNFPNRIYDSSSSSILGGKGNILGTSSNNSSIIGGGSNTLSCYSRYSSIVGGLCNTLSNTSNRSSIIAGQCNTLTGTSSQSSIIGGQSATMSNSCNSVIIGGVNQTLYNCDNTVLLPNTIISGNLSMGVTAGVSGTFSAGANTITVTNGIITSIV